MRQVAIAIETTGSDLSAGHKIIEIGCVEIVEGEITGRNFHAYINPGRPVDKSTVEQLGMTNEFLANKPIFAEISGDLLNYLGGDEVVVFDSRLILPFLDHEITRSGTAEKRNGLTNEIVDVFQIGNKRHPNQNNSFQSLCDRYYVDTSQSELTGALFKAEIITDLLLALSNESTKKVTSDLSRYEEGANLIIVKEFSELDGALDGITKSALLRGVSNHEYPLLPSLFRHVDVDNADVRERKLMWLFKTHAKAHLRNYPGSDVEWLTIAQHHGLPTRLLDWSLNPLVACYFAVQSLSNSDSAIYVYDIEGFKKEEEIDLTNLNDIVAFFPSHATKRITAQSGMFTIHPTGNMKLELESIKKIIIPADRKKYFMEKLVKYGVHPGNVFPDLDGLSSYLRYMNAYR